MPDCDYCDAEFDDESSYLKHLKGEHEGELSRVDRRRVEEIESDGFSVPTGPAILVGVIGSVVVLLAVVMFVIGTGGGGATTTGEPYDLGAVHEHGTIEVTIDGKQFDFSRDRYQLQDDFFHFEGGTDVWHVHGRGVTLEYAMSTLGIGVNRSCVSYQAQTYCDSDPGTSVRVQVNGNSVDPGSYVLDGVDDAANPDGGDHIRIVVTTNGSS